MTTRNIYYSVIHWFAKEMEREMGQPENVVKGHWKDESQDSLFTHLRQEVLELEHELLALSWDEFGYMRTREINQDKIISEAADVANMAMMLADNARRKKELLKIGPNKESI